MPPIVFRTGTTQHAGVANAFRMDLAVVESPIPLPINDTHQTMAFAYALAALGVRIGVGPGEVSPDEAMAALKEGIAKTKPDAMRDLRDRLAEVGRGAVSS